MKAKAERKRRASRAPKAAVPHRDWRPYLAAGAALAAAIWAYAPALNGAFLFDDTVLPFALPDARAPFLAWIHGVRPVLMASYWMNARLSGDDPFSYHVVGLAIHLAAAALVFLIVRRLLEWSQAPAARRTLLAGAVFLLVFFRFTLIISRLRDDNIALAQRVAILEYHLRALARHES